MIGLGRWGCFDAYAKHIPYHRANLTHIAENGIEKPENIKRLLFTTKELIKANHERLISGKKAGINKKDDGGWFYRRAN